MAERFTQNMHWDGSSLTWHHPCYQTGLTLQVHHFCGHSKHTMYEVLHCLQSVIRSHMQPERSETAWNFRTVCQCYTKVIKQSMWDCLEFQNCLSVLYKSDQAINVRLLGISELSVSAIQKWSNNQCETAWNYRTVCQCYTKVIKQSINQYTEKRDFQPTINQSVSQYSEKRDSLLTFAPRCWTAGTPWGTRPCGQWDTDAGCEGSCGGIGHRMCDRSVCPVDWPRVAGRSGTWDPRPPPGSSRTGVCLGVREADRRTGTLWDPMRNGAAT